MTLTLEELTHCPDPAIRKLCTERIISTKRTIYLLSIKKMINIQIMNRWIKDTSNLTLIQIWILKIIDSLSTIRNHFKRIGTFRFLITKRFSILQTGYKRKRKSLGRTWKGRLWWMNRKNRSGSRNFSTNRLKIRM